MKKLSLSFGDFSSVSAIYDSFLHATEEGQHENISMSFSNHDWFLYQQQPRLESAPHSQAEIHTYEPDFISYEWSDLKALNVIKKHFHKLQFEDEGMLVDPNQMQMVLIIYKVSEKCYLKII